MGHFIMKLCALKVDIRLICGLEADSQCYISECDMLPSAV